VSVTKEQQDILNPGGVNVIRDFRAELRRIPSGGARTTSADAMCKYVNVSRLLVFVVEPVEQGTPWVVFKPNDEQP
jgi:phage tail sheath protein FI